MGHHQRKTFLVPLSSKKVPGPESTSDSVVVPSAGGKQEHTGGKNAGFGEKKSELENASY